MNPSLGHHRLSLHVQHDPVPGEGDCHGGLWQWSWDCYQKISLQQHLVRMNVATRSSPHLETVLICWICVVDMLNLCCWCIESLICRGIVKNCWFVSFCRSKRPLTDLRNSAATSCILRPHSPVLTVEQDLQNAGVNGCDQEYDEREQVVNTSVVESGWTSYHN